MSAENEFHAIAAKITGAEKSQLFGKPCYKINGKAFICFFQDCLVAKLNGEIHAAAMSLNGNILFDPSGKGRPMKEWVQIHKMHLDKWEYFATQAAEILK